MRRPVCLVLLALLLLSGCTVIPSRPPDPTVGPRHELKGITGSIAIELTTSTNCAAIGEVVTITGRITNEANSPWQMTTTPPIDIHIRPSQWDTTKGPAPVRRWLQSGQAPATINPVFAPHEVRVYQWQWTAEAVYADPQNYGVQVELLTGEIPMPIGLLATTTQIGVSIGNFAARDYGPVPCAKLTRAP